MPNDKKPLLEETKELLENRPHYISLKDIATASDVTYQWMKLFSRGDIADPSVNRVQRVHDFLSK